LVDINNPNVVLVEAWPKQQEDRAQYKLVQIGLDAKTFTPQALIMFAPNFDPKTAPNRDHYEFSDVKRNAIGAGFQQFLNNFIPQKPPKHWKIVRNKFNPVVEPPAQPAPAAQNARGPAATGQPRPN
jgi:TIGR03009 family protein